MDTGEARFGIYARAPQPAMRVFEDIRLLSRIALGAIAAGDAIETGGLGRDLLARLRGGAEGSVSAAVGSTVAVAAVEDPHEVVRLLRGRDRVHGSYPLCTPHLQTLIAASFGRVRRPTAFLQSASVSERDPAERARKVPAQIWEEWRQRYAPHWIDPEITATALSVAVVFAGSRLTHSAALALIDPTVAVGQISRVMRTVDRDGQEAEMIGAILRLASHLDTHDVPIDDTRRRALNCSGLLSEEDWKRICRRLNVAPDNGVRGRIVRAFLYRKLTGNRVGLIDGRRTGHEVDRFADTLPTDVREELDRVGGEFLAAQGINEPLVWTPELEEFAEPSDSAEDNRGLWSIARPAFATAEGAISLDQIAVAYAAGATTYELARRAGVLRQTISRILAEMSAPTRRGRLPALELDVDRIRHLYEVERLTMSEIAQIMGCSQGTISCRLRDAHPLAPPRTRRSSVVVPQVPRATATA